jgi:spermidine synthase
LKNYFLILLVFVSGMTSLALEMCAERLLSNYLGSSLLIWGIIIGLLLFSLTLGYYEGGRLADRHPSTGQLCFLTALAAAFLLLIPSASSGILSATTITLGPISLDVSTYAFLGTMLFIAFPTILLGMVSPFAIRLLTEDAGKSGQVSGSLYAISTIGGVLGAFLPVLWLIPAWGVRRTLFIFSALLFAASLWALHKYLRPAFLLTLLALLIPLGPLREVPNLIYDQESLYSYIQVTEDADGTRHLILNDGGGVTHSVAYRDPNRVLTGRYWDYYLAAPYFNKDFKAEQLQRVGIIGLAGGTVAHQFTKVYGPVPIDGVEIDPAIVDVGRRFFQMNESNLNVYTQDGRAFLANTHEKYGLVAIDAFHIPYIPFQLATREFFATIQTHLLPTGVVAMNIIHPRNDTRLVQTFVNTMKAVFPSVYTLDVPGTLNTEVVATMQPTSVEIFRKNLAQFAPSSVMGQLAVYVSPLARPRQADSGIVFTDDRAPIEQITDQLLWRYK